MAVKLDHLRRVLHEQLKDAHCAESQLVGALQTMRDAAGAPELRAVFADHMEETRGHLRRIERACDMLGVTPLGHRCRAAEGLAGEIADVVSSSGDDDVRDAALICAAQKVEHYEIALYGCARAYAEILGHSEVAAILRQTLEEEDATDALLTEIAVGSINGAAANPDV